ncbi:chemotaxis protein MotA [Tistlia consotensis]|uniref:Chemotaxis protein MotA n=1 Tax=Tistlia consotensis USBA 355 TaxID=560819 RepID=A0A1Y6BRB6_9PROT|nr:flagellar motor stator protein MotA [Tistlia consotensis]SMF24313.1 chemotaxis protein MotA [Tistlia consotensis USBA 355]SNR60715.1 chemotaxis protein MotA [Tistlia consotensis]
MLSIGGIVVVFIMVFGSYIIGGGNLGIVMHAMPLELMTIGGAAVGAFLVANSMDVVKKGLGGFGKMIKGPKWGRDDYRDLLCLMYMLTKVMKTKGVVGLEPHIEKPDESKIFTQFTKISGDHHVTALICDTLRMVTMNLDDPHQVEDYMERQLEKHHAESIKSADALQTMADGLPALGIVAAVLGVIKTMASIDQPVEILGEMIGGALVGTFLGVFMAYGIVGPVASRLKEIIEEEGQFYAIIRDTITAHLHGHAAQVSVEIGRGNVPSRLQPTFYDLEEAINAVPSEAMA